PTAEAATLALRTQQVIGHESGVADFVDALGGSYAGEALTTGLERRDNAYLARIDELGGMVRAIEQGYPQREIQASAYRYQLDIEQKLRIIAGENEFVRETAPVTVMRIDPKIEREQVDRLRLFRAEHATPA